MTVEASAAEYRSNLERLLYFGANTMKKTFALTLALRFTFGVLIVAAQKKPAAPKAIHIDVNKDKVGAESAKFLSVVGNWAVVEEGGKKFYAADGREWLRGNPSRSLAENARDLRIETRRFCG